MREIASGVRRSVTYGGVVEIRLTSTGSGSRSEGTITERKVVSKCLIFVFDIRVETVRKHYDSRLAFRRRYLNDIQGETECALNEKLGSTLNLVDFGVLPLLHSVIHRERDMLPINRSRTWNTACISMRVHQIFTLWQKFGGINSE